MCQGLTCKRGKQRDASCYRLCCRQTVGKGGEVSSPLDAWQAMVPWVLAVGIVSYRSSTPPSVVVAVHKLCLPLPGRPRASGCFVALGEQLLPAPMAIRCLGPAAYQNHTQSRPSPGLLSNRRRVGVAAGPMLRDRWVGTVACGAEDPS